MVRYSIILPTYNERDNLPLIISMINTAFEGMKESYEVIIVEDSSPDGTVEVAKQLQSIYGSDKIVIKLRPGKLGLGSAYIDGLQLVQGDYIFLMDADMSHHPKYMSDFIKKQKEGNYDVVTGTRYNHGGGVAGWDLKRVLVSRGAGILASVLLQPGNITDFTGSYRLFKRSVLEALIPQVKGRAYVFQMEVIVRAKAAGYSIGEVPIVFVDRMYGVSKLGGSEILAYARGLWDLFLDL
eukprot:gene2181-2380_t